MDKRLLSSVDRRRIVFLAKFVDNSLKVNRLSLWIGEPITDLLPKTHTMMGVTFWEQACSDEIANQRLITMVGGGPMDIITTKFGTVQNQSNLGNSGQE